MIKMIRKLLSDKSLYKFLVVGGICTFVDFVIYMLLSDFLNPICSKAISMICSMILNYLLNKFWSFSVCNDIKINTEIGRYICSQIINITANTTINYCILQLAGNKVIAFIVATGCATVINYMMQRFWVFPENKN